MKKNKKNLKLYLLFLFFSFTLSSLFAQKQKLSKSEIQYFSQHVKKLNVLRNLTDSSQDFRKRFSADSLFIIHLKKLLKKEHSFHYSFTDLEGVYVLNAPDKKFKIFTWQYTYDKIRYFHHGVIQLKISKNKTKLIPLYDQSNYIKQPYQKSLPPTSWIGCTYYNCKIFQEKGKKKYYLLFGFDAFTIRSNIKWLEVLTFDNNKATFGSPIFFHYDSFLRKAQTFYRRSFEFHDFGNFVLVFDKDMDAIIFDQAINLSEIDRPYVNSISGKYSGYKWKDDSKFHFIKNIFGNQTLNSLVNPPLPLEQPITNDGVTFDQKFIKKQNKKNFNKEKTNE